MTEKSDNYSGSDPQDSAIVLSVPLDNAGCRLDLVLARLLPEHSRSRLQDWIREGRVRVDGCDEDNVKRVVHGGERIDVLEAPAPEVVAATPEDISLTVLYEDEDILVIDKPAGLVVHPGSGNWSGTLLNALLHRLPLARTLPRAGIVHRLDKDTSGLLVVACNEIAQTDLVRQLQARTVKRQYLALARGDVRRNVTVDAPIGRHPTQRMRMAVLEGGREARTQITVREHYASTTLVECSLETGRTHQIRVHMAYLGHPLVGDTLYGGGRGLPVFPRQALHAWRLGLIHPRTGESLAWESPIPADLQALLDEVRGAVAR